MQTDGEAVIRKLVIEKSSKRAKLAKTREHSPVKWHITKQKFDKKQIFYKKVLGGLLM